MPWLGYAPPAIWRPFTLFTLILAAAAAAWLWPYLAPDLYENIVRDSPAPNLVYATTCYLVWSLVILPHTVGRMAALIQKRRQGI